MNLVSNAELSEGVISPKPADPIAQERVANANCGGGPLAGLKIACFFPWLAFERSGAWNRFTSHWRFLQSSGANVTIALFQKGEDVRLRNVSIAYLNEHTPFDNMPAIVRLIGSSPKFVEMKQYGFEEIAFLLRYESSLYLQTPRMDRWLDELVQTHDVVTCEYPFFAPLLSGYCKKWKKPLLVTAHDVIYTLHGKHPRAKERLKEKEIAALRLADGVVFVNDAERRAFAGFGVDGVTVLNTSDVFRVKPGDPDGTCRALVREKFAITTADFCLFVGSIHRPNVEAVRELHRLSKRMPEVTIVVAGNCCEQGRDGNFISLGLVPELILDALYRAAAAVLVPLVRGTGTSIKTFEALTYGKVVIATSAGVRGYAVVNGENAIVVSNADDFPGEVRKLMEHPDRRRKIEKAARIYAESLDYRTHFKPYAQIICKSLGRDGGAQAQPKAAVVLVDNNLCDRTGHHLPYAISLRHQCNECGRPFRTLIKRSARDDVATEVSGLRVFSQGLHEPYGKNPFPASWGVMRGTYDLLQSSVEFARELEEGLADVAAPGDVVFIPNALPRQLFGLALLLNRTPFYHTLQFVVMLRYSFYSSAGPQTERKLVRDSDTANLYQNAFDRIAAVDTTRAVRLATDSVELAREFGEVTQRPIDVLPIPHTTVLADGEHPKDIPAKSGDRLRLVFLGDAREEKGFEMLPALVRSCLGESTVPRVEFVFQAFVSSLHHRKMVSVVDDLKGLKNPHLCLIERSLSSAEYQALLQSADVVLLPYDATTYRARTSGPFVEAICADKPVVIPADSWLSGQLGQSGAGETFASGNPEDFVRKANQIITEIRRYSDSAAVLGKEFRAFHNPQTFLCALIGETGHASSGGRT